MKGTNDNRLAKAGAAYLLLFVLESSFGADDASIFQSSTYIILRNVVRSA